MERVILSGNVLFLQKSPQVVLVLIVLVCNKLWGGTCCRIVPIAMQINATIIFGIFVEFSGVALLVLSRQKKNYIQREDRVTIKETNKQKTVDRKERTGLRVR